MENTQTVDNVTEVESPPAPAVELSPEQKKEKELQKAVQDFAKAIPRIKALAKNLGRNQLARVFSAFMEFPFGAKYPDFKQGSAEFELFMIALHANACRGLMHSAFSAEHEQLQEEIANGVVESLQAENKEAQ